MSKQSQRSMSPASASKNVSAQFNKLLSPNLQSKPVLKFTTKSLPTLKMTSYPNRSIKGATNIRLARKSGKMAC